MLNFDVKRKINTLRDILVGKVPDPKAQVEQITIALIFKFMDDIDSEGVELGGEREFFKGDYAKYAWTEIMQSQNSGQERAFLYAEGIEKMQINPELPQLFRDVFRGAFLPYRDPETLNMFLKEINEFKYDNSEDLGNAFEYLLSIMGSQGDAGQFRTPRHIIDMMVQITNPHKNDTILDPACGTAGFLISSYKHILNNNKDEQGNNTLTSDDISRLTENFSGYDISPDMVRLSRVNMYLHKFTKPKIFEYDTLSSQDRWDENYDIILANPPFMTPKGGIVPHNRYRVKANRAEVLFVDYIAEHLNPTGKAAIIVPEGIVFQSANAYKQLREYLIKDNLLYAVISLPAGVFNPYAGVKTSILLFDKAVARATDNILFVKINNDGYDLGAQRREIKDNDIPTAIEIIEKYKSVILSGSEESQLKEIIEHPLVTIATKEQIAKQDYILVGERYKEVVVHSTIYPMVELGDHRYFDIESGGTPSSTVDEYWNGDINWATLVDIPQSNFITDIYSTQRKITQMGLKKSSAKLLPIDTVLVSSRATIGRIAIAKVEMATNQGFKNIIIKDTNNISSRYVALAITALVPQMEQMASGGTFKEISKNNISTLKIPLPPLSVQEQIVAEIEGYQKIIDGAKQVVDNYKPTIKIDPNWEMVKLEEVCDVKGGKRLPKDTTFFDEPTMHPYIRVADFKNYSVDTTNLKYIEKEVHLQISNYTISSNDVYISIAGTIGLMGTIPNELNGANLTENAAKIVIDSKKLLNSYLAFLGGTNYLLSQIKDKTHAVGVPKLALERIKTLIIPLPPIEIQQQIVAQIEEEQKAVEECKKLIAIFEQKIKDKISEVWGSNL